MLVLSLGEQLNMELARWLRFHQTLIKSLLPPFGEVNADETVDKSSSRTSVQPVTQSKAPTVRRPQKKKISSSTQPKALQSIRESSPTTQVVETHSFNETTATADATKSLDAFDSAEEQVNHPKTAESEKEGIAKTFNASTDMPAQSDLLGYLFEEMRTLSTKVDQLETNISKKVTNDIQSSMPSIVANFLKENLSGLLSKALKNTLPQMIKDSIQLSVQDSIAEKLQMHKLSRHYKISFLAFSSNEQTIQCIQHSRESQEKNNPKTPTEEKDAQNPDKTQGEQHSGDDTMANAQGEQSLAQELLNIEQAPLSMKKILWFFMLQWKRVQRKTLQRKKELSPPKDPTPPRDESKGKGIATEEPLNEIMPYIKEGAQLKEMKRLADLNAEKEKSDKSL
uniref:Uncharacterized protein n=1 Tax=Tanacetum cinerariifolium TaxID=118510 RepID=A0A6L2JSH2_TANCI|nr:hypothetical protein [Tanacetum cinerariifolium]